jgi:hypothetical protein
MNVSRRALAPPTLFVITIAVAVAVRLVLVAIVVGVVDGGYVSVRIHGRAVNLACAQVGDTHAGD